MSERVEITLNETEMRALAGSLVSGLRQDDARKLLSVSQLGVNFDNPSLLVPKETVMQLGLDRELWEEAQYSACIPGKFYMANSLTPYLLDAIEAKAGKTLDECQPQQGRS